MPQSAISLNTVRRLGRLAVAVGATLTLVVIVVVGWLGWYEYGEILQGDQAKVELEARVLDDHASRTVETASVVLAYLEGQLQRVDLEQSRNTDLLFTQALAALPFLRSLQVLDAQGVVVAGSVAEEVGLKIELARLGTLPEPGRDLLGRFLPGRGLSALSDHAPIVPVNIGFIPFSRTFRDFNGKTQILIALINPDFFSNYQLLTLTDTQDSVYLVSYPGEVLVSSGPRAVAPASSLVRHPVFNQYLPGSTHAGYVGTGASPETQVVSFRLSKSRPLVVIVEQPLAVTMSRWIEAMRWFVATAFAIILFLALMTFGVWRSLRDRGRALEALLNARAEVVRREQDMHVLVKSVQELLFRTDSSGALTYVNKRWEDLTGQSVEHTESRLLSDCVEHAGRAAIMHMFSHSSAAQVRIATASMRASDNSLHRFDFAVVPLREGDKIIGFAGSAVDVTKRLAAESGLQHQLDFVAFLLEISPLPVATFDRHGRYVTVNRAWEDFTGYSRRQVVGRLGSDFVGTADAAFHAEQDAQLRQSGGSLRYEVKLRHRDGSLREVILVKVVLPSDDQHANGGLLSTMMDVSEFRAAERAQETARHAAEESSRTKSDFIANISHELRTPLQSILGFSELGLMRGKDQPKLLGMFEDIHAAGGRMLALVNDLLDVSKISSTLGAVNLERTEIRAIVSSVLQELTPQTHARRLHVEIQLGSNPLIARVDPVRFAQVVRNVVANAIKFSPEKTSIEVGAEMGSDDRICISVRDHGRGIPPEELERIFEAFVQSTRTKDGSGGTGLGLAICRTIMDAHGGTIQADNAPDGGAIFSIYLPARRSTQRETDFLSLS